MPGTDLVMKMISHGGSNTYSSSNRSINSSSNSSSHNSSVTLNIKCFFNSFLIRLKNLQGPDSSRDQTVPGLFFPCENEPLNERKVNK